MVSVFFCIPLIMRMNSFLPLRNIVMLFSGLSVQGFPLHFSARFLLFSLSVNFQSYLSTSDIGLFFSVVCVIHIFSHFFFLSFDFV